MTNLSESLPLARHFYEVRREVLAACGTRITPWYRLSQDERAAAVAEGVMMLEALRRAREEHDFLTAAVTDRVHSRALPDGAGAGAEGV
ncbi:hypothetical protein ACWD4V_01105 [Streptomyces tsukubensis]